MTTPALIADRIDASLTYADLKAWLGGKNVDKMIAAMSTSALAKKPGRVLERVKKTGGKYLSGARVISWDKKLKFVYGTAFSSGSLQSAMIEAPGAALAAVAAKAAVFQTDYYLRTKGEYTELDAVTVAAILDEALPVVEAAGCTDRQALTAARLFSTGLDDAGIAPHTATSFLVPLKEGALEVINMPIERIEHEEKLVGQVLVITGWTDTPDAERIEGLAHALTKEGHPGKKAFAELVRKNARPL